eukprot:4340399-Amphidinium_carterae.1
MQEFFTKQRLTAKQLGHRLWVNNKETRGTPPDLDNAQSDKIIDLHDCEGGNNRHSTTTGLSNANADG